MHVVADHALKTTGCEDGWVKGVVGTVDDSWRDIAGRDGDGSEECSGGDGDAVTLVGANEIVGGICVFGGIREGRDGWIGF
jgi:hypothetical protein